MPPRVGETHHRAKLKDGEVARIRQQFEEQGAKVRTLATEFKVSIDTIKSIVSYRRRVHNTIAESCEADAHGK